MLGGLDTLDSGELIVDGRRVSGLTAHQGLESGIYNALISDTKLDIPTEKVAFESRKSSIGEQVQTVLDQMGFMIYMMIGLGAIICIASVYVAVNMMVTENRSNISMLKVLGYRDRQIGRIVLSVNHIFLPLGIVLGIPAALTAGSYFGSLALVKRKIARVDMIESLKDNRE